MHGAQAHSYMQRKISKDTERPKEKEKQTT